MEKRRSGDEQRLETLVAELFKHAAPRPQPPPDATEEVRRALYQEWQQVASRRTARRRAGWLAAAASLLIAAGAATLVWRPQLLFPQPVVVASVERVSGSVRINGDRQSSALAAAGLELVEGQTLTTATDAMVALRPAAGGSLRLAAGSSMKLLAPGSVELIAGALYFDSDAGDELPPAHLSVVTAVATVRDVGTQFVTRLGPDSLAVSVREGLVTVERGGDELIATVGERLTLDAAGDAVRREPIATFGEDWRWTERIAPAFEIEGRRLVDVLGWYARETGRELEYGSLDAQRIAGETILHLSGAVDLERMTALTGLLATADLEHRLVGATIYVTVRQR